MLQRKAEGAGMHSRKRRTITAVPCCGFVQKHQIFGGVKLGRGRPKLAARGKASSNCHHCYQHCFCSSPSPFPTGKLTPGACSLKKIIARL